MNGEESLEKLWSCGLVVSWRANVARTYEPSRWGRERLARVLDIGTNLLYDVSVRARNRDKSAA